MEQYFQAWNTSLISKNGDGIRNFMSRDFVGYWAHSKTKQPDPYFFDYDLEAVLKQMDDAEKSFETTSVAKRDGDQQMTILGRETNMIAGKPYRAQCMFVWKNEHGKWKLLREYIELEG
ncbi:DUF4440 domain-containing protein [Halalkalibacillus sediminis]|uniref:DUF4440 domain-containing protein n=2 Tax=Halalkalibacillus sediminis TaxID=2018042 RepID=A0A2I0QRP8_9BACI|nr:DUF4440 domain-containing protein [Halalkalibacillus sediminis]